MYKLCFFLISAFLLLSSNCYAVKEVRSLQTDRKDIVVTVYNNNLGLIEDAREIKPPGGLFSLVFMDVASSIIPESAGIITPDNDNTLSVHEQSFEYDLLSIQRLMNKYIGKKVNLYYGNPVTEKPEIIEATLIANNDEPVFKIGDEITFGHSGRILFPHIPGLYESPALIWLLDNVSGEKKRMIRMSYLTKDLNWRADYIVTLDKSETRADISGWVSVDNKSGIDYRNASLRLIAGKLHRADDVAKPLSRGAIKTMGELRQQFQEKDFFEYHTYIPDRRTTIGNNKTKRISLMNAYTVPVTKRFILRGKTSLYYTQYRKETTRRRAGIYVDFRNDRKSSLGMPLPEGLIRVYKYDEAGNSLFIGEDRMEHTPENETVSIKIGEAFDVISQRKQTDWLRIAKGVFETSFEISIRNHKKEDIVVNVTEPLPGDWKVLKASHDFKKTDANTLEFDVSVPSGKETVLSYRIRVVL